MAEEMMNEEMAGIGSPPSEEQMVKDVAEVATKPEDAPSTVDAMTMASNFNSLDEATQIAVSEMFKEPVLGAMQQLLGEKIINDFTSQVDMPMEGDESLPEAPMEEEGLMASPPTEEPMPAMAAGGLTASLREMKKQGMTPEQFRSTFK